MRRTVGKAVMLAHVVGSAFALSPVHAADLPKRCEPAGTRVVDVALAPPAGTPLAGIKVRLDYPKDAVSIPGSGDDGLVKSRVGAMPPGVLAVPNDEDGDLIVAMVAATPIPAGRIFAVTFDRCAGQPAPTLAQYRCTVEEASDEKAQLVGGAVCTVTLVNDKEGSN